jgi:hypothetical protein
LEGVEAYAFFKADDLLGDPRAELILLCFPDALLGDLIGLDSLASSAFDANL